MLKEYVRTILVVPKDRKILILLGKIEEKLSQDQGEEMDGEYMDVCVHTGFHGMDRVKYIYIYILNTQGCDTRSQDQAKH